MDYNRLIKVIKWNIIADKQQIVRNTIGFTIAFCVIVLSQCSINWMEHYCPDMSSSASLILFVVGIYLLVKSSQVCFNMKTKTALLSYAMLPATKGEKFVANVFHQTVICIGQVIAALVVTDVLQSIVSLLCSGATSSLTLCMMEQISFGNVLSFNHFVTGFALCLLTHSAFVLGGTFFRKHNFLYTTIVIFVVPIVLTTFFGGIAAGISYIMCDQGYVASIEWLLNPTESMLLANIILILIAIGLYYLAYHYFCRIQVINNKFFN